MVQNNIILGLLAHVDAGKTTLSEALLFESGAIRSLGRVDHRDTLLDSNSQERARGITIFSKQAAFSLSNRVVTLLDTPGHVDFSSEMERTLSVLDYAVLIVSAADGIQGHTETIWNLLARHRIPTFIFVNKMDQPGTNREKLLSSLKARLSSSVIDMETPDAEEIALLDEDLLTGFLETGEVSEDCYPELIRSRKMFPVFFGSALRREGVDRLMQALDSLTICRDYPEEFGAICYKITHDDAGKRLTHMKITGGTLRGRQVIEMQKDEEILSEKVDQIRSYFGDRFTALTEAPAGTVVTVTGLSGTLPGQTLGSATECFPPLLEPVLTYRLALPKNVDATAFLPKIKLLEEEDPELSVHYEPLLREIQVRLMGVVQTEILKERIRERFDIDVSFEQGSIVYKETIRNTVEGVGHFEPLRHYAEVHLLLSPLPAGSGIEITADCPEDTLAKNWQRLILTHIGERRHRGVLTGAPLTDVRITLVSGKAHPKHTEGGDFRQATYRAVRHALMQADSVLLEPYYRFRLSVPTESVGRAMTDLDRMGATFQLSEAGSEDYHSTTADHSSNSDFSLITGLCPVSRFANYHTEVASYTKGRGTLSMVLDSFRECTQSEDIILQKGYDPTVDLRHTPDSVFCSHGSGFVVPWDEVPNYMHLPSELLLRQNRLSLGEIDASLFRGRRNDYLSGNGTLADDSCVGLDNTSENAPLSERIDIALGTDDIDRILHSATHSNSHSDPQKEKRLARRDDGPKTIYKGTEHAQNLGVSYLLVDGYNVIHAWHELEELAKTNLDAARGKLLDTLCNFQPMEGSELIVVFDAYRLQGHATEYLDYHNIHVVYTKTAETADRYIEHFAHEHGRKYRVRVVTSDGMEQIIIRGAGCIVTSSREFEQEVSRMEQHIRDDLL